tara:strand:+ start:87 stop:1019 length:933 start_codon:yes stop_codon:yes gene_type:complete
MIYLLISQILIGLLFINFYKYLPVLITQNNKKIYSGGYFFLISLVNYYFFSYFFLESNLELTLFPLIAFIIGALDDKFNINPVLRIFLITILVLILINSNSEYNINFLIFDDKIFKIETPFDIIFTCLCFLLLLNSINFSDGINCLAGLIFLFYFSYLGIKFNQNIFLTLIIIIALIFFLYMNWKNKCFLGDGGVYLLSFLISQLIIINYKSNYEIFHVEEILLLLYLPGYDLLRLFVYRIFRKKNPFKGDNNHIHHLLLKKTGLLKTLLIYMTCLISPVILLSLLNLNYLVCIMISILIYISLISYAKN